MYLPVSRKIRQNLFICYLNLLDLVGGRKEHNASEILNRLMQLLSLKIIILLGSRTIIAYTGIGRGKRGSHVQ